MSNLPPATLDDVCEGLNELRKAIREGFGVGQGSFTNLEAIAVCLGMGPNGAEHTSIKAIDDASANLDRVASALERIANYLENQ